MVLLKRPEYQSVSGGNPGSRSGQESQDRTGIPHRLSVLLRRLSALSFICACLGVAVLVTLYRWPKVSVPVYYFTVRPAFAWFGLVAPFLLVGVLGVRLRWFLCGCALWAIGFVATEEVLACLKMWAPRLLEAN